MSVLLELERISYSPSKISLFRKNISSEVILNNISFNLEKGKTLGIVGESGSGKTTLAKIIGGILKPDEGILNYNFGVNTNKKGNNPIQILFQNSNELINPSRKVGNMLNESYESKDKLSDICILLDIQSGLFEKFGHQLSGGERQRIGLARLLSVNPELLILDEPFSAQDPDSQKSFLSLFKKIKSELDITIICISHDIYLLKEFADDLIVLFGGNIMETGDVDNIVNSPRHPYTNLLIEAFNYKLKRSDFKEEKNQLLKNKGCSFFSRCEKSSNKCLESVDIIKSASLITYCNHPL